jgi:hypothetical protein
MKEVYSIRIRNKFGTFISGAKFSSKGAAKRAVITQKKADKLINSKGYINSFGSVIKMRQSYAVVKRSR